MIYRNFGQTNKKISVISFGGMRFEDQKNIDACAELICEAYKYGINYFDTAPGYGDSEKLYGIAFQKLIKDFGRNSFMVATKTGAETRENVRKDIEESIKRLKLDYIDFYYVWCVMSFEDFEYRRKNGVIDEFIKLYQEGLIKNISISTHMNGQEIEKTLNEFDFASILLGYSAMNFNYRDKGIEAAHKKNIGTIVMNPLGGGIIPQNPHIFSFLKTQKDETVTEAALRFLIDDNRINSSLVGFANQKQLKEAINAVKGYKKIPPEEKLRIKNNIKTAFNKMCTACGYCNSCPQNIPIPELMDTYNHYLISNKKAESIINRLKWHWDIQANDPILRACIECKRCEKLCTQKLPIIERIKTIKEIADKAVNETK